MSSSWVAIDFETANAHRGSPCAVGMAKVVNGRITDTWGTLIQPPAALSHFSAFNIGIHGITPDMLTGAPDWKAALSEILAFADDLPLVAHNAGFDMGVIRAACSADGLSWPELRFTCSQVIARRTWKLLSYGLPYCADAAGIVLDKHHDAGADATASAEVMLAAMGAAEADSLDMLLTAHQVRWGWMTQAGQWQGSHYKGRGARARTPLPDADPDADPDGELYGAAVCITGTLASMTRDEAHRRLAEAGAQPEKNVTKRTTILVSASQTQLKPGDTLSGKARKAQALLESGQEIEVLDEDEFLRRLGG
ncbi:exonuclease domain-containing protein [Streptomyces caatingaensis]|uniref:BRCT domain-containing protein n=1 Tax=Streptomyces caatingaensis TaxID=1678637 RepID=A0A0K9XI68_9ACTN|nr:exonuclease domain-containing protein [Streptomyces caatingaensis]KNB52357.1 hypothetical protein AC230_12580 [Streptomyces caatingaensis]